MERDKFYRYGYNVDANFKNCSNQEYVSEHAHLLKNASPIT